MVETDRTDPAVVKGLRADLAEAERHARTIPVSQAWPWMIVEAP